MDRLAQRIARRYLYGGLVKLPPKVLDEVTRWATETVVGDLLARIDRAENDALYRKITKKYGNVTPQLLGKSAGERFKLDLGGWAYLPNIKSHAGALQRIQKAMPYFIVLAQPHKMFSRHKGGWDQYQKALVLGVPLIAPLPSSFERLERTLDWVQDVIRHEIVHMAQTILGIAFGQEGATLFLAHRLDRGQTAPGPGLPSSNIMTPEFMQELNSLDKKDRVKYRHLVKSIKPGWFSRRKIYTLDDAEFYSLLSDDIRLFNSKHKNTPHDAKTQALRQWVGAQPNKKLFNFDWLNPRISELFTRWKKEAPSKWKKAVKEFYKAVV